MEVSFNIGSLEIGGDRTFIISEIGNNHNGSLERAFEMVDDSIEFGADCVKFQMRNLDEVYRKRSLIKDGEDLGTEYIIDLLQKFELSADEHKKIAEYCDKKNILYMCTAWDKKSIEILESFGVQAYKVASADLTNMPLIANLVQTNKPLILSTGMSVLSEIKNTVEYLKSKETSFALLHCNSTYPAPIHDINLKWIENLKKIHPICGYSGHERGINISLASIPLGAKIIERHYTLDRTMEGPDHAASLLKQEFYQLVQGIREIEASLGSNQEERNLSQGELINRENLSKSLVSSCKIKKGTILEEKHIKVCSPGQGLSPQLYNELIGKTINRNMEEEDFFFMSDITKAKVAPRKYSFDLKWGVPVRYHDFKEYSEMIKPEIFEFHLSYSDMDLDFKKYLEKSESGFVVHAPELFSKSRLMDLATPDEVYRKESILETQRVVDITKKLKDFFPKTKKPLIVANIGGFSMDENIPNDQIDSYYQRFLKSLNEINFDEVELIPQNMAPFPWHFGGQRYQNMFVSSEDIIKYCEAFRLRICFDISHAMLACNHFDWDFYKFSEEVAPYAAHIHVGDASGVNGEGLQVGKGDIDFKKLGKILKSKCPNASFIPEIWQGHKNQGEDFWIALDQLEGYL